MEQLFPTVAQISFTIVGLFFVALTVEPESRDFWFGNKFNSRFAYINLLFMLLPGFLALGALMPPLAFIKARYLVAILLLIVYWGLWRELRRIKKSETFHQIKDFEESLDFAKSAGSDIFFLLLLVIFGVLSYFNDLMANYADFLFALFLFSLTITSIIPVNVFLRVYAQMKEDRNNKVEKTVEKTEILNDNDGIKRLAGINIMIVILSSLAAFLLGLFFRRD
jgi:hypothetical protein